MGFLTFEDRAERRILSYIKQRLKRRGLKPDLEIGWEVHGPHSGMNYQVYIGCCTFILQEGDKCICPGGSELVHCPIHGFQWVVIYPRTVYALEDDMATSKWWNVKPEDRIPITRKQEKGKKLKTKRAKPNERWTVKILDTNTIIRYVVSVKRLANPTGRGNNWEIKAYDTYDKPHTHYCRWYRTVKGKML